MYKWVGAANLETIFRVRNCNHPLERFCLVSVSTMCSSAREPFHRRTKPAAARRNRQFVTNRVIANLSEVCVSFIGPGLTSGCKSPALGADRDRSLGNILEPVRGGYMNLWITTRRKIVFQLRALYTYYISANNKLLKHEGWQRSWQTSSK